MSQYSTNQNQNNNYNNNNYNGIGPLIGKIIVGLFVVLSVIGNIGSTASTVAVLREVPNKTVIVNTTPANTIYTRDNQNGQTVRSYNGNSIYEMEEQIQRLLALANKEPHIEFAEHIRPLIIDIELKEPNSIIFEAKPEKQPDQPELFAERGVFNIQRLKKPQIVYDEVIFKERTAAIAKTNLPSFSSINKRITKKLPIEYKTLNDFEMEKIWETYLEYQRVLPYTNTLYRNILRTNLRTRYRNGDNDENFDITGAMQEISSSTQVSETDFTIVNIAEENTETESYDVLYRHDSTLTELENIDVTSQLQIQDIPKDVNKSISAKIIAW